MLHLALVYHMHQPYYKDLLTKETSLPWVRLHGIKDYLDMVQMLEDYPSVHQTFNLVPSLLEQIQDYERGQVKDKFLELSLKPASELTHQDKDFIRQNFFSINRERVIAMFPRYYQLYFMKQRNAEFGNQDYLDLQVWFNLSWFDPSYRKEMPELRKAVDKGRFFTEEEKRLVLDKQLYILKEIIPGYKKSMHSGQIETILSPYYHPILPLLYNTRIAKEANNKSPIPKIGFAYPEDARAQIERGVDFYKRNFTQAPSGMWPSEESVSEHILPFMMEAGISWIVADEAILFKSLGKKKRDTSLLYQPHLLKREEGEMNIVFRDRNLSDLIGFVYYNWRPEDAVADLMRHLSNIASAFKKEDTLVTIAMDGENAWEYFLNDGHDFLELFYKRLSEADFLKCVTVSEYLKTHKTKGQIKRLAAGSWIYANFGKWLGSPHKNKGWEYLSLARKELEDVKDKLSKEKLELAFEQMYIAEGSDWYWWLGEDPDGSFDKLFRMHLTNFYRIIGKEPPDYLQRPVTPN